MTAVDEAGLVMDIVKAVKKQYPGTWVFKVVGSPYQMTGVPDLILCVDGLFVALEVKFIHAGESHDHAISRASPGQRRQISDINKAGGVAAVVTSVDEALTQIIRAYDNNQQ
jgi:hypothetical protein